jgi:hypothetical protein
MVTVFGAGCATITPPLKSPLGRTTTGAVAVRAPSVVVNVILVVPAVRGVTTPEELTVATAVLLDTHVPVK